MWGLLYKAKYKDIKDCILNKQSPGTTMLSKVTRVLCLSSLIVTVFFVNDSGAF